MITFTVGSEEKHTITFSYDTMWGKIEILVDGKKEITSRKMVIGKTPFQFQVGDKEKHDVRIELNNPLGFAFRGSDMKAYVDNSLVREEHIGASLATFIVIVISIVIFFFILGIS